jgi:hypothetical protein
MSSDAGSGSGGMLLGASAPVTGGSSSLLMRSQYAWARIRRAPDVRRGGAVVSVVLTLLLGLLTAITERMRD